MVAEITVGAEVLVTGLPLRIEDELIAANTFANPEYGRRERLGLRIADTPRNIELWKATNAGLVVPRGTLPIIIRLCRDHGIDFEIEDQTVHPSLDVALSPGELYPYQQRALDELLRFSTGMLEAPTGSGKTNILLSAIPRLNTTTLIIVHTVELFKQTRERCRQWLGIEPGALGAGKWELKPISVAMVQTLARRDVDAIADYFGAILVDECHHSPARTWARLLNRLPARYKFGFTATAFRKDGLGRLMFRTIGNITAKVSKAEVEAAGKMIVPEIETVQTDFYFDLENTSEWTKMIGALVRDDARNELIVDEIRARLTSGTRALILSDRIAHVDTLAELLSDLDPVVLTGELSKSERETAMVAVRAGAGLTIATTSLLGEGVDVPGWGMLFLVTPIAGGPRTLQAVGRVSRAAPGKDRAVVVDFVDRRVPALVGAHRARERMYARG